MLCGDKEAEGRTPARACEPVQEKRLLAPRHGRATQRHLGDEREYETEEKEKEIQPIFHCRGPFRSAKGGA